MDLTQLKMFCALAESGSVVRAANLLHRVPSNLTTRLRQLEEELGTDLFIREKQRLRLSPMGHNFLCYALRILALSEEALNMAKGGEPTGNFALGSMESTAATRLPTLLAEFHQRYPAVSLALSIGTSGDIIKRVRAGTLAAALVDGPINIDELNSCKAFHEQMVLISSTEHALITQPADATGCTLFGFRPSCSHGVRFENWLRAAGVQPGNVIEIQSYHAMLACVTSGGGLALLPAAVLEQMPGRERVRQHPIPAEIRDTDTWLVWRSDAFTPNVEALKYMIIEQFEEKSSDQRRFSSTLVTLNSLHD